jgi:hypothetical protein
LFRRIASKTALAMAVAATSLFALAPDAHAGTDCTMPLCGIVNNFTNNQIRIDNGAGGFATVYPGESSARYMKDVDRFTFPGTSFVWLGVHYSKGSWMRIRDGMWVRCAKVPGTIPICALL